MKPTFQQSQLSFLTVCLLVSTLTIVTSGETTVHDTSQDDGDDDRSLVAALEKLSETPENDTHRGIMAAALLPNLILGTLKIKGGLEKKNLFDDNNNLTTESLFVDKLADQPTMPTTARKPNDHTEDSWLSVINATLVTYLAELSGQQTQMVTTQSISTPASNDSVTSNVDNNVDKRMWRNSRFNPCLSPRFAFSKLPNIMFLRRKCEQKKFQEKLRKAMFKLFHG